MNTIMSLIFGIVVGLGVFVLAIFFWPSSIKAAVIGAPFMPTPKKIIKKALEAAGLKPEEKLYDLGCGTGEVLVIGEKYFQASAMGFEYSLPLFILSKINIFASGLKKSAVRREDIFGPKVDLRDADVVFLFLTPKAFLKLKEKFEKELKPGARVVAYSSPLLFWEPCKIIEAPGASAKIYLYNNFELRNAR